MLNENFNSKDLKERVARFNKIASSYEQYRPGYPDNLFNELIELSQLNKKARVLEIGTGTGKATIGLAQRGISIVGVDPNENLLQIAKEKLRGYDVDLHKSTFEEWHCDEKFDMVISAQSFHWIPQEVSYKKSFDILKKKGHIALFWNMYADPQDGFYDVLSNIYKDYSPDLWLFNYNKKLIEKRKNELAAIGYFSNLTVREYSWTVTYTKDSFIGFLSTFGAYSRLQPKLCDSLFSRIGDTIDMAGMNIVLPIVSILYLAQRQ